MKPEIFLLVAMAAAVLIMGAGCTTFDSLKLANASPTSTSATSTADGNDVLAVSAEIDTGIEIVKTPTGTAVVASRGYLSALDTYSKSGLRFQFANCSGYPGTFTIKRGIKFMIDNRDNEAHIIGIGANKYRLGEYGYAIVQVQKAGDYNITCDGGGSARVVVQN